MTTHASGTFEVNLNPQTPDNKTEGADPEKIWASQMSLAVGATLGRMSIDKQFHGDLEATSKGEMLTAVTGVKGSAGYVAIERVSGTLHGCSGSFVFQHSGTVTRGTQQLSITVVPDSGTDQLMGLAGKMAIKIADGKHSYDFEYTLAETP
jgi:predicted flavoprotein YhiN